MPFQLRPSTNCGRGSLAGRPQKKKIGMPAIAPPAPSRATTANKQLIPPHRSLTVASLLPAAKKGETTLHKQRSNDLKKSREALIDALFLSNEERQKLGDRMRACVAGTPIGTHGSEWMSQVAVAPHELVPAGGFGQASSVSLLASSMASTTMGTTSTTSVAAIERTSSSFSKSRTLPAVASAPTLRRGGSASSSNLLQSKRFTPKRSDVLSPRTLLAAEERLLAYLASREEAAPAPEPSASPSKSARARAANGEPETPFVDPSMLSNAALRDFWDADARPLPKTPGPTAVASHASPVDDKDAIALLNDVRPLAGLQVSELLQLLRVGERKLLPKYAVPIRAGALGNSVFIVLRGRLEILPSRLELQDAARMKREGAPQATFHGRRDMAIIAGPTTVFGELSFLMPVPRERTAITLEDTELLVISPATLSKVSRRVADLVTCQMKAEFAAKTLKYVPFFNTLPELAQRQVAPLLDIECFQDKEHICHQGEPGDKMYIILWGTCEVWRAPRRGWDRSKIASYSGFSALPWFGEVFQWVDGHGRAGDVICTEATMTLSLHRDRLAEFIFYAPGFKALSMSAATAFTVKSVRVTTASGKEVGEKEIWSGADMQQLRFAVQWARMVSKLLGAEGMENVALVKVQQGRRKHLNTMDWVHDVIEEESRSRLIEEDEETQQLRRFRNEIYEEERRKLLEMATATKYGDSRSLVTIASTKAWRTEDDCWNVRTEMLRKAAKSGALQEERERLGKRPRLPDTFPPKPPPPKPTDRRRSRLDALFHESHIRTVDYSEVEYVGPGRIPTPAATTQAPEAAPAPAGALEADAAHAE